MAARDQRYYVSDWGKMMKATGWSAKVGVREGVGRLYAWLRGSAMPRRSVGAAIHPGQAAWAMGERGAGAARATKKEAI